MIALTKLSLPAFRMILVVMLVLGHFAICACPAAAVPVSIEPADSTCCEHEKAPEPQSCCGDDACTRDALTTPDDHAVQVSVIDMSVSAAPVICTVDREAGYRESLSSATPVEGQLPTHSPPSTLLFCVLTQ